MAIVRSSNCDRHLETTIVPQRGIGDNREMQLTAQNRIVLAFALAGIVLVASSCGGPEKKAAKTKLTHEQTLAWIDSHKAWRPARKTKPIWARAIEPDELGKEFHTADHAVETAREGFWLCAGVAGEPWFQKLDKIAAKYEPAETVQKKCAFDNREHSYRVFRPKEGVRNWVAQVGGDEIEGFFIRPNYDMDHPLYSPSGGYVVKNYVADPYRDETNDVWLVQQSLFESTYELAEKQ
jgi:hypothetical protein